MFKIIALPIIISLLFILSACSPSQEQVDQAVQKEMQKRDDEKARVFKYIEEYAKTKGGIPGGGGGGAPSQERPTAPSLEDQIKNPKKIELGDSPSKGPKNAKVTIVVFSDFQCPFCTRVLPTLEALEKKYEGKIKTVFKHQPLPFHQNAKIAAQASLAAHRQGKFWPMHDIMFKNQQKLDRESLIGYAKQIGLNEAKFGKDIDDPKIIKQIEEESAWATSNGLGGTPSFLINGVTLVGAQPQSAFENVIDKVMK
ncbi:MAG: thioredoxin domain-containing protein [Oligoflexia bacterium]|nr:thioredoxin domain-containing protein [Oligoflexia bacterium]